MRRQPSAAASRSKAAAICRGGSSRLLPSATYAGIHTAVLTMRRAVCVGGVDGGGAGPQPQFADLVRWLSTRAMRSSAEAD